MSGSSALELPNWNLAKATTRSCATVWNSDHTVALFPAPKMRQQVGFLLQFAVLVFLPLLIVWQLNFGFKLLWMPMATVAGIVIFLVGTKLRES